MNAHRILTGAAATLALAGSVLAQEPTIIVINDSFASQTTMLGDDQLIRVDDLNGNSSFMDSTETNLLFQYAPSSAGLNFQFVDVEVREEGGLGVVYFSNNRAIRQGEYKLVSARGGPWELYDIQSDRTELNDLSASMPDKMKELRKLWHRVAKDLDGLPERQRRPVKSKRHPWMRVPGRK